MNRRTVLLVSGISLAVIAAAFAWALVSGSDSPSDPGGPVELPPASESGGVPTATIEPVPDDGPGAVDPSLTADDPVPDDLVGELFALVEASGDAPLANETYTVEFEETTEKVRIEGSFENGPAEYEFEYDDGAWKLESDDE